MGTRWAGAFPRDFADTHPTAWTPAYEACLDERADVTAPTLRVLELPADDDPPSPRSTRLALLWPCPAPAPLADVFPILANLGLRIAAHAGFDIHPADGPPTRVEEFELVPGDAAKLRAERLRGRVTAAFEAVWTGLAEDDSFNRLVVAAGLSWREVAVLRSTYAYLRQLGTAFTPTYAEQTLRTHFAVAQLLVELFHARFDPTRQGVAEEPAVRDRLEGALAEVANLSEDRLLRSFASVLTATTRTNFYQRDETGAAKPYLVLKVVPADLPLVPEPRPAVETFVYSPRMEGLHLRSALVARGGLRWSERPEDYRTEVLGLLRAQRVKNAVIVPHGAKGAFIVKRPGSDTQEVAEAVRTAYATFIRGLLDITDNLVGSEKVTPADVVCHDGPDSYLVVAADKGTARFSDLANSIAQEYGYWLGDAFASGGSAGYDHKALGVTARGAWESLRRHLGELGLDPSRDEVSFVGIGDMSGDVFGNAMLLSDRIRLVAAFDHRHVFLDPDPDPATSYAERRRLFVLPRSSWADYRSDLISAGGGVLSRTAKQVPLSPQVRALLGVDAVSLPADELIRAVLRARVDVLFNGGIGTYVKASTQSPADAGDRGNDAVRVDADQLGARVVVEGGNLGLTQAARVEYALAGGRVNADFVDNSAGVDISDREVNLKILLAAAVRSGRLTIDRRDALLRRAADQVVAQVLADNARQAQAISVTQALGPLLVDPLLQTIRYGTEQGLLDPARDVLPDEETAARRRAAGLGLARPEIAVILAMSKSSCSTLMLASDAPDDPTFTEGALAGYLPTALAEFSDLLATHPLRREIAVTVTANEVFNRGAAPGHAAQRAARVRADPRLPGQPRRAGPAGAVAGDRHAGPVPPRRPADPAPRRDQDRGRTHHQVVPAQPQQDGPGRRGDSAPARDGKACRRPPSGPSRGVQGGPAATDRPPRRGGRSRGARPRHLRPAPPVHRPGPRGGRARPRRRPAVAGRGVLRPRGAAGPGLAPGPGVVPQHRQPLARARQDLHARRAEHPAAEADGRHPPRHGHRHPTA
ncbi:MAG TPA: NAD-glutamate dehydrogenase domain-containing protein [Microlunatus sp.]